MREQSVNRKVGLGTFFWRCPVFPIEVLVFLVGAFLYVWLRVEPVLEYHRYGPYFLWQSDSLARLLSSAGGLASLAGLLLGQLNHLNWLGALVFAASEYGVFLAVRFYLARLSGRAGSYAALFPLFVLLLLRNRYGCPVPVLTVGFVLALVASAAYVWLPWRRPWSATATCGLFSCLLFFLAGRWPAVLFAVLCGWFVSMRLRHWSAGLGCLALALGAPLVVLGTGNLEMAELVNPLAEGINWRFMAALYLSVPAAAAVLALLPKSGTSQPAPQMPRGGFRADSRDHAVAVFAFLLGWTVVWMTFEPGQKSLAQIDYFVSCGQYESALAAAKQSRALNEPAKVRLQLALYHTGRLAEDLFSFPNLLEEAPAEGVGEDCRAQSQALLELGLVNDAEHMACEALVMEGERPDLLRLLARINHLKERPKAAQVFLNALSRIPFQREHPNEAWPIMDLPMSAAECDLLAGARAGMLTNDVLHEGLPLGRLLEVLLASNPTNRMAFEYLMADDLLGLDLQKAVEHLRLVDNFKYARIPRAYEEALLLFQQLARAPVDLKGRAIRAETIERFRQFKVAAGQFRGSTEELATLAANFGDTYWYYFYALRSRERAAEGQASAP